MSCTRTILAISGLAFAGLAAAADDLDRGETVYKDTCIACHGGDGAGSLPGVPDLTEKTELLSQDDAVLLKHMVEGFRSADSQMEMPPRGSNPALTDADLKAALRYMRNGFQ